MNDNEVKVESKKAQELGDNEEEVDENEWDKTKKADDCDSCEEEEGEFSIYFSVSYYFLITICQKQNLVINFPHQHKTKMTSLVFIGQCFRKASINYHITNRLWYSILKNNFYLAQSV